MCGMGTTSFSVIYSCPNSLNKKLVQSISFLLSFVLVSLFSAWFCNFILIRTRASFAFVFSFVLMLFLSFVLLLLVLVCLLFGNPIIRLSFSFVHWFFFLSSRKIMRKCADINLFVLINRCIFSLFRLK